MGMASLEPSLQEFMHFFMAATELRTVIRAVISSPAEPALDFRHDRFYRLINLYSNGIVRLFQIGELTGQDFLRGKVAVP